MVPMRLFAAIVPPRAVLDEVQAVVEGVRPPVEVRHQPKRGLRDRLGGKRSDPAPESVVVEELRVPDVETMYIPITGFGNVTQGDSVALVRALAAEALTWRRPTVHLAGGAALEFPGDESVWVKSGGETEDFHVIGRGVPQIVQRLGFFVDRRAFRGWLSVGTITDTTTASYLERVVAALDAFEGLSWTVETVTLMRGLPEQGKDAFKEMEQLALAGG